MAISGKDKSKEPFCNYTKRLSIDVQILLAFYRCFFLIFFYGNFFAFRRLLYGCFGLRKQSLTGQRDAFVLDVAFDNLQFKFVTDFYRLVDVL